MERGLVCRITTLGITGFGWGGWDSAGVGHNGHPGIGCSAATAQEALSVMVAPWTARVILLLGELDRPMHRTI